MSGAPWNVLCSTHWDLGSGLPSLLSWPWTVEMRALATQVPSTTRSPEKPHSSLRSSTGRGKADSISLFTQRCRAASVCRVPLMELHLCRHRTSDPWDAQNWKGPKLELNINGSDPSTVPSLTEGSWSKLLSLSQLHREWSMRYCI